MTDEQARAIADATLRYFRASERLDVAVRATNGRVDDALWDALDALYCEMQTACGAVDPCLAPTAGPAPATTP